jgi:hypothetical protein
MTTKLVLCIESSAIVSEVEEVAHICGLTILKDFIRARQKVNRKKYKRAGERLEVSVA